MKVIFTLQEFIERSRNYFHVESFEFRSRFLSTVIIFSSQIEGFYLNFISRLLLKIELSFSKYCSKKRYNLSIQDLARICLSAIRGTCEISIRFNI